MFFTAEIGDLEGVSEAEKNDIKVGATFYAHNFEKKLRGCLLDLSV